MYVLASRLDVYVGITATSRVTARTATSGAACRYCRCWEHLVKIRKPAARGPSAEPSRKVACFRQCQAGHDVAMLVVALGPRSEVASLDATAIASGGCRGNTAGARGAGLMPRRHRTQVGRTRARQPGPRRAGAPDALRATVHWLSVADGRRRRSEDREPRKEAGPLTDRLRDPPYAEQYAARQRARWHLGLGEGPVDLLGTRGTPSWLPGSLAPGKSATRVSCSVLRGTIWLPFGSATQYKACAMPMANAGPWTVLAKCCACGAPRPEVPRSSSGPDGLPGALRPRPWRMSEPASRGEVVGSGTG